MNQTLLKIKGQYARLEQAKKDYTMAVFNCNDKIAIKHHKIAMACSKRIRELTVLLKLEAKNDGEKNEA